MKDESVTEASLRQFLLGKSNEHERERIESLFLTDSNMRDRVLAVEQDLIEDYLEGTLSSGDREEFVLRYAQTAEQQRKLRITRSIKDWAIAEDRGRSPTADVALSAGAGRNGPSASSPWSRFWATLRLRSSLVVPIAVAIILAVVFAFIWLNRRNEQRRQLIEQEIVRLNSPDGLREFPPRTRALQLSPLRLRSAESPSEVRLGAGGPIELQLVLQGERHPSYDAVVRRHDGDESFTIPNLHASDDGTIRLRLPPSALKRGLYLIQLTGIASESSTSSPAEYQLSVVD